ncbi:MAG: SAF domain-containing protein [Propionibacteriaceae bacterium]|jgi:hypothetical protein|nr:SAF domain-containing protein [Propionibacteriaceae bacterium]
MSRRPTGRRRPWLIGVGLLLMVSGILGSLSIYQNLNQSREVLIVAVDIPQGARIARSDLTTARLAADDSIATMPAGNLDQLLGRFAATDLLAGSLLTPESTSQQVTPAAGQAEIGLVLAPNQHPAGRLLVGDKVQLVADDGIETATDSTGAANDGTQASGGSHSTEASGAGADPESSGQAVIASLNPSIDQSSLRLTVTIDADQAVFWAAVAADSQVSLILLSREA